MYQHKAHVHKIVPCGMIKVVLIELNTVSIQIAAKNLLVCPGLPVESEEICVCVWQLNVDGRIWIGRGGRERA